MDIVFLRYMSNPIPTESGLAERLVAGAAGYGLAMCILFDQLGLVPLDAPAQLAIGIASRLARALGVEIEDVTGPLHAALWDIVRPHEAWVISYVGDAR